MSGRRALAAIATVAAALAVAIPPGLAGSGGSGSGTTCRFASEFTIWPGLSVAPSSGSFASVSGTGTLECDGSVAGHHPTGRGTFGAVGRYGTEGPDSCLSGGEGTAVQSFTLPTAGGEVAITNPVTFTWRPLPRPVEWERWSSGALISGEFKGESASGTFEVAALEGDCVTAPVTRVLFTARGVFPR